MAYDSTKLRCIGDAGIDSGHVWIYGPQADAHATTEGAGYFSDGGSRGMRVGDLVMVIENAGGTTAHSVTAVATGTDPYKSPGAATISAGQFA